MDVSKKDRDPSLAQVLPCATMEKSMKFSSGESIPEHAFELTILPWERENAIPIQCVFKKRGELLFQETFPVKKEDLFALTNWLQDLWQDNPPFSLPGTPLQLVFSHREHIGERYFWIEYRKERFLDIAWGTEGDLLEKELSVARQTPGPIDSTGLNT